MLVCISSLAQHVETSAQTVYTQLYKDTSEDYSPLRGSPVFLCGGRCCLRQHRPPHKKTLASRVAVSRPTPEELHLYKEKIMSIAIDHPGSPKMRSAVLAVFIAFTIFFLAYVDLYMVV